MEIRPLNVSETSDLPAAFDIATRWPADGIVTLLDGHITEVAGFAARSRLPSMCEARGFPLGGGLMSYGPHPGRWYGHASQYVDKILKGAKPVDLPVEQPTEFELVINGKTAQTLGLSIPQSVLIQAAEVVQ